MALQDLLGRIGPEIEDPEEETFLLFSRDIPSQDLGFVDARAAALGLAVAGREYTIHQSPTLLTSNREGGTTGAVVWKITPLVAEYLASADGILRASGVLGPSARVLELGCGVSALVGLVLAPAVASYVLTDQPYVARLVERNISENLAVPAVPAAPAPRRKGKTSSSSRTTTPAPNLRFAPLDWELDEVSPGLLGGDEGPGNSGSDGGGFDVVIACDCIYNEALIKPLVQTCADVCALRKKKIGGEKAAAAAVAENNPTVCVVAQQLRDPDVLETWLREFLRRFQVWRVPHDALSGALRSNPGFVIHIGVLRGAI